MYEKGRTVRVGRSVALAPKNLQVVSFDADWNEIYLGTARGDHFSAVCPNSVPNAKPVDVRYDRQDGTATITSAKWCPLDQCTVLVLGSQFGLRMYEWDGSTMIYEYDFSDNGIGVDERLVGGAAARGIAAVGPNYVAVGIHTGTILLFEVTADARAFVCRIVDSQRSHVHQIADLASTTTAAATMKDVLVSADETGVLNVWALGTGGDGLVHRSRMDSPPRKEAVTALALWNRVASGIIVAAYGSGLLRIYTIPKCAIVAEVAAHAGWITGLDLASQAGLLVTAAEDGYVRVWKLSPKGRIIEGKRHSSSCCRCTLVPFIRSTELCSAHQQCLSWYLVSSNPRSRSQQPARVSPFRHSTPSP